MHLRLRLVLLSVAATALAGCGGSDFKGAADTPADYATYRGDGVTIDYPKGWKVTTRKDSAGGSSVTITPKQTKPTPSAVIRISTSPDAEKRFAKQVKSRRALLKAVAHADIDSDEKVDVPGTKEAHRLAVTVPSQGGSDPVKVKSDSLDLLRDNGDALTVVAAEPQRKGDDDLDPKAVVDSLRLTD